MSLLKRTLIAGVLAVGAVAHADVIFITEAQEALVLKLFDIGGAFFADLKVPQPLITGMIAAGDCAVFADDQCTTTAEQLFDFVGAPPFPSDLDPGHMHPVFLEPGASSVASPPPSRW